jgi:hypothetical protein
MTFSAWRAAFEELRRGRVGELRYIPQRSRLWRIAESLEPVRLHTLDDEFSWDPNALVGAPEQRAGKLFLGIYSEAGLRYALESYGLWERLVEVAREEPILRILGAGDATQQFVITDGDGGPVLVDMKAWLRYPPDGDAAREHDLPGPTDRPWFSMEWLTLQNPYGRFTPERPPLPGQDHPGLGAGRQVMELMLISAWRLGCVGIAASPAWFHNAVMYRLHYRFVDPVEEGRFLAMVDAWQEAGTALAQASGDMQEGRVKDGDGEVVQWRPGPLVAPLLPSADLEQDPAWLLKVEAARREARYVFPPVGGLV